MARLRKLLFAAPALLQLACITVYHPTDAPPSEASLAAAIQVLQESSAPVVMLEDGFQLEAYVWRWQFVPDPVGVSGFDSFGRDPFGRRGHEVRMLTGPERDLYLPYAWIRKVSARSWPLWVGVEIEVAQTSDAVLDSPLVVWADDLEEAQRLTDAIECIRRVRLLSSVADEAVAAPAH